MFSHGAFSSHLSSYILLYALSINFSVCNADPSILDAVLPNSAFKDIQDYYGGHGLEFEANFPGLYNVLEDADQEKNDPEDSFRQIALAVKGQPEFGIAFNELDEDLKQKLSEFMDGKAAKDIAILGFDTPLSPAVKQHIPAVVNSFPALFGNHTAGEIVIYDDKNQTKPIPVYVNMMFENWGQTVENTPGITVVPSTVVGVQNTIRYAISQNKRVRVGGFRHTWSNMYSQDSHIFVSLLDLANAEAVPSILPEFQPPINSANEFKRIELAPEDVPGSKGKKRLVRVGGAVTNEEFRQWSIANGWTLPLNVIMVEITMGGSNAPICHGAGIKHKTLSDQVRQIEYVDANGVFQAISDPEQLKAAAGSFGLLGVVTHVTFELDKMTYAHMKPLKQDVNLAIPPPPRFQVPAELSAQYSAQELEAARLDFIQKAENSYYCEWFWFPYQQKAWVNCWDNTEDSVAVVDYPTKAGTFMQWLEGWIGGVMNDCAVFRLLPGKIQASIMGIFAMTSMPPDPLGGDADIKTYLIDGLHFRRGIQNMRVRDIELQIPIPPLASDPSKPDWSLVQRAWWDAIAIVYADENAPMRTAIELRVMGDSDMIMAPQSGNSFGTASIEVLTTMAAVDVWPPFAQAIIDKWTSYEYNGKKLNVRPHWAKEWNDYNVNGLSFKDHVKQVSYAQEIPRFKNSLVDIGRKQNWTLDDLKARFSNPLLDDIFFS
ncbi:hypothetical protein RUND412_006624 [Rhizina undulata]